MIITAIAQEVIKHDIYDKKNSKLSLYNFRKIIGKELYFAWILHLCSP